MTAGWVDISFDVMGETQVARTLQLTDELSRDMSEPLNELMDLLLLDIRIQFVTEGAAARGVRWQQLSDEYGKWKAEHYPGRPMLVRDGAMKGAMLNKLQAVHVGPEEAVYEPLSEIAGFHQSGADWLGPAWDHPGPYAHHLPQRKMVDLTDAFKHEAVDRVFARWIAAKLLEARTGAAVAA